MMSYDYPHPVSRTYQYKKITKPLLERKRRARINRCLDELKDLMVDALETEGENISKLEKADILELTVRHLQRLHASRPSGLSSSASPNEDASSAESRWQSGFGHCAAEACRYLAALPGESGERLARHLASGLQTTRKINVPVSPRIEIASPIQSLERTTNFFESRHSISPNLPIEVSMITESRQTESPMDSSQYSIISESSDNLDTSNTSSISARIIETANREVQTAKIDTSREFRMSVCEDQKNAIKTSENKNIKPDVRSIGADDEEEIDVEGVDEGDPMWRPW